MQCNTPVFLVTVYTHCLMRLVLICKDFTYTKQSSTSSAAAALQSWVGLGLLKYKTFVYYNSVNTFYYD
jgi:hypothetical protein